MSGRSMSSLAAGVRWYARWLVCYFPCQALARVRHCRTRHAGPMIDGIACLTCGAPWLPRRDLPEESGPASPGNSTWQAWYERLDRAGRARYWLGIHLSRWSDRLCHVRWLSKVEWLYGDWLQRALCLVAGHAGEAFETEWPRPGQPQYCPTCQTQLTEKEAR